MKTIITIVCFFSLFQSFAQTGSKYILKGTNGVSGSSSNGVSGNVYNARLYPYSVVADGVTDNAVGLQAAINACTAAGGGAVYVGSGTILTSAKIVGNVNVTLLGDGSGTSIIQSVNNTTDTLYTVRNVSANGNTIYYSSNPLVRGIVFNGSNTGGATVGMFMEGCTNWFIDDVRFNALNNQGLLIKNCLEGEIHNTKFYSCQYGIKSAFGGGNLGANTLVTLNLCTFYYSWKWAIDWTGGGQFSVINCDFEGCGNQGGDTLTGCIYYHGNTWPGGLNVTGGWAEQNYGSVIFIDANSTGNFSNFPAYTSHSIEHFQDLGQQYSFTKRNLFVRGTNQKVDIRGGSMTGAVNNIVVDGGVELFLYHATNDATPSNVTRNGATITIK